MTIQPHSVLMAGILLLALVTVETGGYFLTRVGRGAVQSNALQKSFFRAGHAHAGVLLVLSVAILAIIDQSALTGAWLWMGKALVPIAAILMPAGFFLSVLGRNPQRPNRLIALLWLGALSLTAGLIIAGVGLIAGAIDAM